MNIQKIEKGSIPSEIFVTSGDYYIIDAKSCETLAYVLEHLDLDAISKTVNEFVEKVQVICLECK